MSTYFQVVMRYVVKEGCGSVEDLYTQENFITTQDQKLAFNVFIFHSFGIGPEEQLQSNKSSEVQKYYQEFKKDGYLKKWGVTYINDHIDESSYQLSLRKMCFETSFDFSQYVDSIEPNEDQEIEENKENEDNQEMQLDAAYDMEVQQLAQKVGHMQFDQTA